MKKFKGCISIFIVLTVVATNGGLINASLKSDGRVDIARNRSILNHDPKPILNSIRK